MKLAIVMTALVTAFSVNAAPKLDPDLQVVRDQFDTRHAYGVCLDTALCDGGFNSPIQPQPGERCMSFNSIESPDLTAWYDNTTLAQYEERYNEERPFRFLKRQVQKGGSLVVEIVPFQFNLTFQKSGVLYSETWHSEQMWVCVVPFTEGYYD